MKLVVIAALLIATATAHATGTTTALTVGQKADAIQAVRSEANQARQTQAAMLNKFNTNRDHFTAADSAAWKAADDAANTAQARIDAIRSTDTAGPTVAQYSEPAKTVTYSGTSPRPGYATINVAARTLGSQPVQTPAGVVPASSLPAETQVAVPHVPALIQEAHASHNGSTHRGSTEHGSGRGADNAHDHAFR